MKNTPRRAAGPMFVAFRNAEAAFRLHPSDPSRAGLIDASVALLIAGVDSPNLRILAGDDSGDFPEVAAHLEATLRDLGLEPLDQRSIALRTIDRVVEDVLNGSIAPRDGAAAIYDAWHSASQTLGPALSRLATIADYLDDGWETWGPPTEDFLTALRTYRAGKTVLAWDLATRDFVRGRVTLPHAE